MGEKKLSNAFNDTALLIVDVQSKFCDPDAELWGTEQTAKIARRIKKAAAAFRKAGIPIYAIYYARNKNNIDYFEFTPDAKDEIVIKGTNSALKNRAFKSQLKKDGRKKLLICGFNISACLYSTVVDACNEHYDVDVLIDLCGNDKSAALDIDKKERIRDMKKHGATFLQSKTALKNYLG